MDSATAGGEPIDERATSVDAESLARWLASLDPLKVTAAYYIVGGVWPLVSLRSFMFITGPKREGWLVQSFGLYLAAAGAAMVPLDRRARPAQERLAVLGALALAAADTYFVARRRIRPVYLADAAVQLGLVGWIATRRRGPQPINQEDR